jgi:hypothetical protein
MFDPSTFSNEPTTLQHTADGWEDNSFKLPIPGTKFVGLIGSIEDGGESMDAEGRKHMWIRFTLLSGGTSISTFIGSYPSDFGNKASSLENLIRSCGMDVDQESTHQELAEAVDEIWREQIPVGFDIKWVGKCSQLYKNNLKAVTGQTNYNMAADHATKEQKKKADKESKFTSMMFKDSNGQYQPSLPCETDNDDGVPTTYTVRAMMEVRNFLSADDVDDQLGG